MQAPQTEKQKMTSGLMYDPMDKQLVEDRLKARLLLRQINQIPENKEVERKELFRKLFGKIGDHFLIENSFRCDYGYNIYWGENSFANFNCIFLDVAPIHIGKNVMLATNVSMLTATHPIEHELRNSGLEYAKPISIGDNVWIGGGAIINPGVTIGENSVIGSGSVVTKDIPANVVAVGNPCKVVKHILENKKSDK